MSKFVINNPDWAEELEQGLEEYMGNLFASLDDDEEYETLSGQPFCGCETCVTREMLWYATPIILQGNADGAVELEI